MRSRCCRPGRFLMPGDLEGSPALTFAPLDIAPDHERRAGHARRDDGAPLRGLQDACREAVLPRSFRPARPADRAGRHAGRAERRPGRACAISRRRSPTCSPPSGPAGRAGSRSILTRRIDRILFAATKADHVHHTDHDNLARLLERLTRRAAERAAFSGAEVRVVPLAAVRATREVDGEARRRAAAGDRRRADAGRARRRRGLRRRDGNRVVSRRLAGRSGIDLRSSRTDR